VTIAAANQHSGQIVIFKQILANLVTGRVIAFHDRLARKICGDISQIFVADGCCHSAHDLVSTGSRLEISNLFCDITSVLAGKLGKLGGCAVSVFTVAAKAQLRLGLANDRVTGAHA